MMRSTLSSIEQQVFHFRPSVPVLQTSSLCFKDSVPNLFVVSVFPFDPEPDVRERKRN